MNPLEKWLNEELSKQNVESDNMSSSNNKLLQRIDFILENIFLSKCDYSDLRFAKYKKYKTK